MYEVLDDATHPEAEGPPDGVVHGRRRDADRHEEEVGQGEILQKMSNLEIVPVQNVETIISPSSPRSAW